jgi:hypothetical protein
MKRVLSLSRTQLAFFLIWCFAHLTMFLFHLDQYTDSSKYFWPLRLHGPFFRNDPKAWRIYDVTELFVYVAGAFVVLCVYNLLRTADSQKLPTSEH